MHRRGLGRGWEEAAEGDVAGACLLRRDGELQPTIAGDADDRLGTKASPYDPGIGVVASKVDENKSMQKELLSLMRQVFGTSMIRTPMKDSAEIDNVTARLMTVYEVNGPMTSKAVRDRCLTYLNGVNEEILVDIRSTWPSHAERMRKEGLA